MKFKIEEVLKHRGKNKMWLSKVTNITPSNIGKLCNGENKSIKTATIDKICTALECNIGDILENEQHYKTLSRLKQDQTTEEELHSLMKKDLMRWALTEEGKKALQEVGLYNPINKKE